jgi:hypothetical protein
MLLFVVFECLRHRNQNADAEQAASCRSRRLSGFDIAAAAAAAPLPPPLPLLPPLL